MIESVPAATYQVTTCDAGWLLLPSGGAPQTIFVSAVLDGTVRKAGFSLRVSPRPLKSKVKLRGSLTQDGIKPQRTNAKLRAPALILTIGTGWVGATL